MIGSILEDVRVALRTLLKARGFTAVTVLTLAVAIGANTAIFSVVDGVLFRPLPYPEADRLVTVAATTFPSAGGGGEAPFSDRGYWHFVNNNRAFDGFGAYSAGQPQWPLTGDGQPLQVDVGMMTASAFEIVGTLPQRGRFPTAGEDVPDAPQVALLSDGLWIDYYGSDPGIIGRVIELNGQQVEVIGVMPRGYNFPTPEIDVWIPRRLDPASENFGGHHLAGIARLAPGSTVESAVADAESLIGRFDEVGYGPTWFTGIFDGGVVVRTVQEEVVGNARQPLLILLGTVGFVLLIACSNVANLVLVRAEGRAQENAVRMALGSGRGRLIRYVLTESLLLALVGGAAGILLAYLGTSALVTAAPASIPRSGYPFRSPDPKIWWCQRNRITRSGARIIRGHSWNLTSGSSRRLIVRTSSVAFGGLKGSTVPGAVLPEDGRRAGGCFDARVVPGRPPSRRGLSLRAPASRYGFGSKRCGTSPTRSTG